MMDKWWGGWFAPGFFFTFGSNRKLKLEERTRILHVLSRANIYLALINTFGILSMDENIWEK